MAEAAEAKRGGRSGGRASRVAERAAPLAAALRPVRAGMSGGQYRPLTEAGVAQIHEAALQALEQIGLANAPPSGVEILTGAGAILGSDGRIRFPRALVEDMLAKAARGITLHARNPAQDLHLQGTNVHFGTAGAAVHIVDPVTLELQKPSIYSESVWEARKERAIKEGRHATIDWLVVTNRLQGTHARNRDRLEERMGKLAKRVGFRVGPGLRERVIYRELFPFGLTVADLSNEVRPVAVSCTR